MINPTSSSDPLHFPVMLDEVIKICSPNRGGIYIDCTFGGGSYSNALLKFPNTQVVAMDRDKFVLKLAKKNNIPIQISMGGGYSVNIKDILEAHSNTYRLAQEIFF